MRKVGRLLADYLILSALLGLVGVAFSYPELPSTPGQWLAIFVLALPLQLAGELVGHGLWNNRLARSVEGATAHKSLSLLRIGYGVFAIVFCIGLAIAVLYGWHVLRPLLAR